MSIADSRLSIMFVGDSLTVGFASTVPGGYRSMLWNLIVTYTGKTPNDCGWSTAGSLGHSRICGASGERTDEILARVNLEAPAYAPECVFIHVGTNDTTQLASGGGPNTVSQSMGYVTSILDKFRTANPTCKVFICKIIDNQTYPTQVNTYNTALTTLVQARADYIAGHVVLVDMYTILGAYSATNYFDATHLNARGYGKMAQGFYDAFITKF